MLLYTCYGADIVMSVFTHIFTHTSTKPENLIRWDRGKTHSEDRYDPPQCRQSTSLHLQDRQRVLPDTNRLGVVRPALVRS